MYRCNLAAMALAILVASDTYATNYYVRTSGNDGAGGTTAGTAFATIQKAATLVRSGDTVYVGSGEYTEPIYLLGAKQSTLAVRFIADKEGTYTGDNGPVTIAGATFRVAGSNYVQLTDFTFRGEQSFPTIWQSSFNGLIKDCVFEGGTYSVMVKGGSLTLDTCQFSSFQNDAVQVDGAAELVVRDCTISGTAGHAINIRKVARVSVNGSTVTGSSGDGVHVKVTSDEVVLADLLSDHCECTGTSPVDLKEQARDLLQTLNPTDDVYRQMIDAAENLITSSLSGSLWKDEWHAEIAFGPTVYENSHDAIEILNAVYTDDVDFEIIGGEVVVGHPFVAEVTVIGAAIVKSGYDAMVTVRVEVGGQSYEPWGPYGSPTQGNVNDGSNPRAFEGVNEFTSDDGISVSGRSWFKKNSSYSGSDDSHWEQHMVVDSLGGSSYVNVLRDGDDVPDYNGYSGQASAELFLQPYIDENDKISLEDNQAIFLFELGTTNLSSNAADFQDLVTLVTMRRVSTPLTDSELLILRQAMDRLLESDRTLANCAINEGVVGGGSSADLDAASQHYDDGISSTDADEFTQASIDYRSAWEDAKQATGNQDVNLDAALADDIAASPPSSWPAISTAELTIDGSTFSGNSSGVLMATAQAVTATGNDFSTNGSWGMAVRGTVTVQTSTISNNGLGGLFVEEVSDGGLSFSDLQITDNTVYGVFFENCQLSLGASAFAGWTVSGSQHVLANRTGSLALSGISISGGSTAGVLTHQGNLTLNNCNVSSNGYGIAATESALTVSSSTIAQNTVGIYSSSNLATTISNSTMRNNSTWGAVFNAPSDLVSIDSSSVYDNAGGLAFNGAVDGDFALPNTVIRDNTSHGLHFEGCNVSIADQGTSGWQSLRNGNGISCNASTLQLTGVEIEESSGYGVYSTDSTVTLTGGTISAVNGAYVDSTNQSFTANATWFEGTTGSNNWGIDHRGGVLTATSCVITGFANGVYVGSLTGPASILNITNYGATGYGVYQANGTATVKNSIFIGMNGQQGLARTTGNLTHSHNLIHHFSTPLSGTSAVDSELFRNPRFVDAANGDYRPSSGSPLINAGVDLSVAVPTDIVGNARPSFRVFEIGAYEFVNADGSLRVLRWNERN